MSDVEDSHPDDDTNNEVEEVSNHEPCDFPELHPEFTNVSLESQDPSLPCIHQLNNDCLFLIFSYFDIVDIMKLSWVCRRWYNVCLTKMGSVTKLELNPTFSIFRLNRSLSQSNFVSLLMLTQDNLTHLDISQSSLKLDSAACSAISKFCPNLVELNISKVVLKRKISTVLGQNLPPKLKSLILNGCGPLKDKCLENLIKNTKNLEKLDLSYNHKIPGSCITNHLANNKMSYFDFTECSALKRAVVHFVLASYESSLEVLDLSLCKARVFQISTDMLPQLITLKVFKYKTIPGEQPTPEQIINFMQLMPQLCTLDLENNMDIEAVISNLPTLCPGLSHLNLSGCLFQADVLSHLNRLPSLETLLLDRLSPVGYINDTFNFSSFVTGTLAKCSNLTYLSLKGSQIDDDAVFMLISQLMQLRTLDLRSCYDLNGNFISDCAVLDRTDHLTINLRDTFIIEETISDQLIPAFLDLKYGYSPSIYMTGDMEDLGIYNGGEFDFDHDFDEFRGEFGAADEVDGEFWEDGYPYIPVDPEHDGYPYIPVDPVEFAEGFDGNYVGFVAPDLDNVQEPGVPLGDNIIDFDNIHEEDELWQ